MCALDANKRGEDINPPGISPARGPPLWDECDAVDMGVDVDPEWDASAQPAPHYQVDQHITPNRADRVAL